MVGEMGTEGLDAKAVAVVFLDHEIAFVGGNADHRMAEIERNRQFERAGGGLQGIDVDRLGVDQ